MDSRAGGLCGNGLHDLTLPGSLNSRGKCRICHNTAARVRANAARRRAGVPEAPHPEPGYCRNRHDLSVLGRSPSNRNCVACARAGYQRYQQSDKAKARAKAREGSPKRIASRNKYRASRLAAWRATPFGQLSMERSRLRYEMNQKISRIAELERELQSNAFA